MRWLLKCCCCISLRIGSLAAGSWTLFTATLLASLQVYNIKSMKHLTQYQIKHGLIRLQSARVLALLEIVFCITLALLSLLLIFGIVKDRCRLLLPYIIVVVTYVVFDISTLLFYVAKDVKIFSSVWIPDVTIFFINCYCVFVVMSFYKELSRRQRRMLAQGHHHLNEEQYLMYDDD